MLRQEMKRANGQLHIRRLPFNNIILKYDIRHSSSNKGPPIPKSRAVILTEGKPSLWVRIKNEASHYWNGTKLLGLEIKISFRLLSKITAGYELTRREKLQFKRTTIDVVRLIPFAAFIIIPFAELLLPVALKMFPNLLPSTYESPKDKQTKIENLRKTREMVSEVMKKDSGSLKPSSFSQEQTTVFNEFFKHVRATGEPESKEQLIQVARLFTDDTVLDNATRPYLIALAKYINLQPFGTDVMLRYRIRNKMLELKNDDLSIFYEGVDQLNPVELKNACASRGIRNLDVDDSKLKQNLKNWLVMRIKEKIPSTLLIMATAYNYGDVTSTKSLYENLTDVLSSIPDPLYHEVKVNVVEEEGASAKQKLAQLKEQESFMKEEEQQEVNSQIPVKDDICLDDMEDSTKNTKPREIKLIKSAENNFLKLK
ncbi:hypothetical protein Kpol_1050p94 [Vanderwaltozyma polyspora DSM 70294]|uniref:Letm1 RBD domain-containing protein n=1 Tax=Vanderwaltozyma polyspora (strain ATCC 22028 / DSM 70294 / BCRC 21397 / CBS 2163 / NBRC 10782 / NRRL Y-8283 / UCD 57-17) TaxID=436907 RepID=A7TEY8_VANPO|nr:uncharacterized protein Kpol_1050p94 [Vanderwaltozyma polyspora DSM 70294]EDO19234.1 hypothetical protein Kpol_1050p94 [Vanderwaltozyma polyspora DSM 70294]